MLLFTWEIGYMERFTVLYLDVVDHVLSLGSL